MTEKMNRKWCVGRADSDDQAGLSLTRQHFDYRESSTPAPAEGEIIVRAVYFSPDPMNHAWVRGMPGKFDPIPVGHVMHGGVAGRVVESAHPSWRVGDGVTGFLDWADYSVCDGTDRMGMPLERVPEGVDLGSGLTALGMTGLCAYLGLANIGKPKPGDTVLVSGASGGIGSLAGQLAGIAGARVIGIAGGADKCRMVSGLGFDAVVDYRAGDLPSQLADTCPEGIDVFFDNVGGETLDAALVNMAHGGRIVICGAIAHYGDTPTGIFNHLQVAMRSLTMGGFFYFDHVHEWPKARARMATFVRNGLIREVFDIADGFEATPEAAITQFQGGVAGRKLVKVCSDDFI